MSGILEKERKKMLKERPKEEEDKVTVRVRAAEIKREMEVRKEDPVYGDALFVTAVCWMKTGPL